MSDQTNVVGASALMGEPAPAVPAVPTAADRETAFETLTKLTARRGISDERFLRRDDAICEPG